MSGIGRAARIDERHFLPAAPPAFAQKSGGVLIRAVGAWVTVRVNSIFNGRRFDQSWLQ